MTINETELNYLNLVRKLHKVSLWGPILVLIGTGIVIVVHRDNFNISGFFTIEFMLILMIGEATSRNRNEARFVKIIDKLMCHVLTSKSSEGR